MPTSNAEIQSFLSEVRKNKTDSCSPLKLDGTYPIFATYDVQVIWV